MSRRNGKRINLDALLIDDMPREPGEGTAVGKLHTMTIPGWRPALLNELMSVHWRKKARLKDRDRKIVATAAIINRMARAEGRRRVHLRIVGRYYAGKYPDPDGVWKSLLDALVHTGLLVDDSREWCETAEPQFGVSRDGFSTTITLEDLD